MIIMIDSNMPIKNLNIKGLSFQDRKVPLVLLGQRVPPALLVNRVIQA